MNKPRFKHNQIMEFLHSQKKLLSPLLEEYSKAQDWGKIGSIGSALNEIETILKGKVRSRFSDPCTGSDCHFVKNGSYKRGNKRIQTWICSRCKRPKSGDKIRVGLDAYRRGRLIQFKLEGIPMKVISELLGVSKGNLEYYWDVLKNKKLEQTDFGGRLPTRENKKKIEADFMVGKTYKILFPIDSNTTLTVNRFISEEIREHLFSIRLAQILLLNFRINIFGSGDIFGSNDSVRIKNLSKVKIKDIPRLPRVKDAEMIIHKSQKRTTNGKFDPSYNLMFNYNLPLFEGRYLKTFRTDQSIKEITF